MKRVVLLLLCTLAACGPTPPEQAAAQPPVAVLADIRPGAPLDEMLLMLDQHLVEAMRGRMEGDAVTEFRQAEAISDRLLEARMPFEWIPAEQYSLESRLRQIQSSADRVNAQVQTGAPRQDMLQELRSLRTDVARLRQIIAQGGSRAPPPLQQLLRADTVTARSPVQRTPDSGPQPAARPVQSQPDSVPRPPRPDTLPPPPPPDTIAAGSRPGITR